MASALAYKQMSRLVEILKEAGIDAATAGRVILQSGLGKYVRDREKEAYELGWNEAMKHVRKGGAM